MRARRRRGLAGGELKVCFTPSARRRFLETVVRLRASDRARAVIFVDRAEEQLRELEDDPDAGAEVRLGGRAGTSDGEVFRFFYRVRDGNVWVLGMGSTGDG